MNPSVVKALELVLFACLTKTIYSQHGVHTVELKDLERISETEESSFNKEDVSVVASGASLVFIGKIFHSAVQYILLVIISRILGVESFGLYMLGFTITSFLTIVSRMGLDNAAIRFVSIHNGTGEKVLIRQVILKILRYALFFSSFITILLLFFSETLAQVLFEKPELEQVLLVLSISIPFVAIMTISLSVTQGFKKMKYSVYCQDIFYPLMNLILVTLFYSLGSRLFGVMLALVISSMFSFVLSLYFLKKIMKEMNIEKRDKKQSAPEVKGLLGYASPLLLITLLTMLLTWVDTIMLGYFRSSSEVGIYSAAIKTSVLSGLILLSFNTIFSPMIADFYNRKQMRRLESMFKLSASWIFIFTLPFFLILLLFANAIMSLFGKDFIAGANILIIIATGFFLNASTGSVGNMLIMSDHQRLMLFNSGTIFIFNIVANYLLIPAYGMIGAAFTSCLSMVSYNVLMLFQVYWVLHMHPYDARFIKVALLGGVLFLLFYVMIMSFAFSIWVQLILLMPAFLISYFGLIYKTCVGDEEMLIVEKIKVKVGLS